MPSMSTVPLQIEARYRRVRAVLRGERPDRIPLPGDYVQIEYRPDLYHLGEPELVKPGEVRTSADGRAHITADGGVWRQGDKDLYRNEEDVLAAPLGRFPVETVAEPMQDRMRELHRNAAGSGCPIPWHYGTLVTRATLAFDWEPFLLASVTDESRFGRILDRFGEATLAVVKGWCSLPEIEAVRIHDDIAGTRGLILGPTWLRRYVFPWYQRFFQALHACGKKALYISDGNWFDALDDILAAGADGVFIESSSLDPAKVMAIGGPRLNYHIKTDNRAQDHGTPADIHAEMRTIRELWEDYPAISMYRGGGGLRPANVAAFDQAYTEFFGPRD